MKYVFQISILILLAILAVFILNRQSSESENIACTMDAFICPNGEAVGRSGPDCTFAPCPEIPTEEPSLEEVLITVHTPSENEVVTSPIRITGEARGNWFFEASFPIVVVDWNGLIIGEGFATAQGDWMTTEFVPFVAEVTYTISPETPYNRGALILKKDNPSGLPEHDAALEMPIRFSEISGAGE